MATLSIELDAEAIRTATAQALIGNMPAEAREKLLAIAVDNLLRENRDRGFGRGSTPLQDAFDAAVRTVAQTIAEEHVRDNPELVAKMRELVRKTADAVLGTADAKWEERLKEALVSLFKRDY